MILALKFVSARENGERHRFQALAEEQSAEIARLEWWRRSDRLEIDHLWAELATRGTAATA